MIPRVSIRNLRKRYGAIEAARDVSFEIAQAAIFGLIGPNGAGKTTTVECLIGLREPDAGEIEVCGIDARRRPGAVKQRIGAALQTTALQDKITPREALALFASFYRAAARPPELLQRFALTEKADAPFDTLSGGQRQRLALALAFVNRPEVVVLDEPTAGLDPQSRRELHETIAQMKRDGHTVLLTTHYLDEAEQLCDRIAVMHHGCIIASGTPRELIASSNATPAVSFITARPIDPALLAQVPGVVDLECAGNRVRFRTATVTRTLAGAMRALERAGIDVAELHVQKSSLEDVFLDLTTGPSPVTGGE